MEVFQTQLEVNISVNKQKVMLRDTHFLTTI